MATKKVAPSRAGPKRRKQRAKKLKPGAVKGERLKPISLHGMELDDILKRLVGVPARSK
jgi:hypothetical protein